ncbi:transmembrane protein 43-like [Mercenaria mercenaria]|uniref:transmembrane protein 43-like n=1 Tax=Mercenaria mercenaria TaxID=6596 RepID=UPI00234F8A87|nr:transmembrane protein 43-like [Mercenaria mercenaria]XP_053377392.1 transmembrane protein 43-like [Mercenaria mercenaria]
MERGRTRVTYQRNPGFFERIGGSLVGILVGLVLLVVGSCLLFWNEGRAVQTAKSLDEGLNMVVKLPNVQVVSMENNGKLVHLIGDLQTDRALSDPEYRVAVHAVKLNRVVEMYQWQEHVTERKYDEGNGQTRVEKEYSYSQTWSSSVIRSNGFDDSFNHRNPGSIPVESRSYVASNVNVGEFILSEGLKSRISNFKQLRMEHHHVSDRHDVRVFDGMIYHSADPVHPQTGDTRIKFEYAGISGRSQLGPQTTVSIIARQLGAKLLPYQTLAGDVLEILYEGSYSAKEIFGKEKMQNSILTWAIRFGGWLLMFIGFGCLTSIVTTLVDWLPIIRDVVAMGVFLMNLSLSISLSLTIIAIGWIFYRPLLGLSILALALTPFIMSRMSAGSSRRID